MQINGKEVKVEFPAEFAAHADKVVEMKAFKDWRASVDKEFDVKSIVIQSVDMFGPEKVGFIKFKAQVTDKEGSTIPSIIFMRGASVAILFVLRPIEDPTVLYTILTVQARFAIGKHSFAEIPAGMTDDNGDFVGVAAKEVKEETGIKVLRKNDAELAEFCIQTGVYIRALRRISAAGKRQGSRGPDERGLRQGRQSRPARAPWHLPLLRGL